MQRFAHINSVLSSWLPQLLLAVAALFLVTDAGHACSTPVFQYALENWPADPYQLTIRHNGLDEDDIEAVARSVFVPEDGENVNIQIRFASDPDLPAGQGRIELRFPFHPKDMPPIVEKPYSEAELRALADSPVRGDLVEQLLKDATAVFLFLKSGSAEADQAARARLREILTELEENLELPYVPLDPLAEEAEAEDPPKVKFTILDIEADDSQEGFLRKLLLSTEPDLATFDEPMAFPVFGRGRALYAIVGRGINRDVLIEACLFITGACSCQVKAQNPGVDLLLRAGWERALEELPIEEVELPPLAGVAPMAEAEVEPAAPPVPLNEPAQAEPVEPPDPEEEDANSLVLAAVIALVTAAALVIAGTVAIFLRHPGRSGRPSRRAKS